MRRPRPPGHNPEAECIVSTADERQRHVLRLPFCHGCRAGMQGTSRPSAGTTTSSATRVRWAAAAAFAPPPLLLLLVPPGGMHFCTYTAPHPPFCPRQSSPRGCARRVASSSQSWIASKPTRCLGSLWVSGLRQALERSYRCVHGFGSGRRPGALAATATSSRGPLAVHE